VNTVGMTQQIRVDLMPPGAPRTLGCMSETPPDALGEYLGIADLLLVFDGWCGVCTGFADWVARRASSVRLIPSQTPGLLEATRLTRADLDREAWAFERTGRGYAGAAAINRVLRAMGGGWGILALAYALPGIHQCEDAGYRWFARHRGRFARWGSTPACERPGAACAPELPEA
jgi:predicted DCC family thiol-disulfide oxidoreductase YuxK